MAAPSRSPGFSPERIPLPTVPPQRSRREFPLLATAAPVVGSLVMWAVTGSPFALVFAFLGPVVAVGSMVDDRRQGRRSSRAEAARFSTEVESTFQAIEAAHQRERDALTRDLLSSRRLSGDAVMDPEWWRQDWKEPIPVCLGFGAIRSSVELEGAAVAPRPAEAEALAGLRAAAATLVSAPVIVDACHGIGVIGPPVPAAALARSVASQLAFRLSPADTAVAADGTGCFGWARTLPHPAGEGAPDHIRFLPQSNGQAGKGIGVVCAVAADAHQLPRECRVIVRVSASGTAVLDRSPSGQAVQFRPWFTSDQEARALALRAARCAASAGLAGPATALPTALALSELSPAEAAAEGLPAAFSVGPGGPVVIDLVQDGPHAIIGGTTGSGKSELLVSWVLAMAATSSPAEVNFLLVDFKGGSSFGAISGLPHTVGVITDLDQRAAERALSSLRAELHHRERVIATAGARSLGELAGDDRMPRLVIIVDEYAVVVNDFPDLQSVFADLASRGRSLGIHLILCTQRPAGVIRDSVLANCSLRLSLRVNNGADSTAVVGTAAAADLPVKPGGRCLISVGGARPVAVQVALAGQLDVDTVRDRYLGDVHRIRRPWCEPLPPVIPFDDIRPGYDGAGLPFGLADVPDAQAQPVVGYTPGTDGNLAVLGGLGAGKTGVLAALREASRSQALCTVSVPGEVEGAWDAVVAAIGGLDSHRDPTLYLVDDLDTLIGRFGADHQPEFIELLARLMREAASRGSAVVLTASRVTSAIQSLLAQCDSRLVLRLQNRQEHLMAGGDGTPYSADLPPGAGIWRGHRVQVALATSARHPDGPGTPSPATRAGWPLLTGQGFALVSPAGRAAAELLRTTGHPPTGALTIIDVASLGAVGAGLDIGGGTEAVVLAGDPSSWQAQWSLFAAARARGPVVFTGCSVAEFRALAGSRRLPPPLGPAPGAAWILVPDGSIIRTQLP